jgi:hypothetical protein
VTRQPLTALCEKRFSFLLDLLDDVFHFVSAALPLRPDDGMASFCQKAGIGESGGWLGGQVLLRIEGGVAGDGSG